MAADAIAAAGGPPSLPVSVVIPALDRVELISRAVRSAQAQQPAPPAEIIVVDDRSSDDTGAVARDLGATVIRHDVNRGRSAARNSGISAATHEWVAFLDSDDEWLPDHLARLWPRRDGHVLVGSAAIATGAEARFLIGHPSRRPVAIAHPRDLLVPQNPLALSGVLAHARALREVGGFGSWETSEDLDLWLRLLDLGSLLVCPEPGYVYHLHAGQVTSDGDRMRRGLLAMVDSHRGRPWWTPRLRDAVEVTVRWDALREAQRAGDRPVMRGHARWLLGERRRLQALVSLWAWRRRLVRREGEMLRAGVQDPCQNTRSVRTPT